MTISKFKVHANLEWNHLLQTEALHNITRCYDTNNDKFILCNRPIQFLERALFFFLSIDYNLYCLHATQPLLWMYGFSYNSGSGNNWMKLTQLVYNSCLSIYCIEYTCTSYVWIHALFNNVEQLGNSLSDNWLC